MLRLEQLEARLTPAGPVWVGIGIIAPNHQTGEPAQYIRLIQSDDPHNAEHVIDLNGRGRWDAIAIHV